MKLPIKSKHLKDFVEAASINPEKMRREHKRNRDRQFKPDL